MRRGEPTHAATVGDWQGVGTAGIAGSGRVQGSSPHNVDTHVIRWRGLGMAAITGLRGKPHLKVLDLRDNSLTDMSGLEYTTRLQEVRHCW